MIGQLAFFIRHSLNDMRVNGRRTVFALLCIAAGVAAIVSLQTLAVMIGDTLTGNLQENNRGDIQIQANAAILTDRKLVEQGLDEGVLVEEKLAFFGQEQSQYLVGEAGLGIIQAWADQEFPGEVELTFRQPLTNVLNIFLGSGTGASLSVPTTGAQVPSVVPVVIEAAIYPYYGEIQTLEGTPLAEALKAPTDIVISQQVAEQLGIGVGETVRLSGAAEDFTVRGIVATEVEVKDPSSADSLGALFGFYYLDHRSIPLFPNVQPQAEIVYLKLREPDRVGLITSALAARFPYLRLKTTEDLRENYTELARNINQLVTVMGLVSLLLGCIGIINTMQVIVRRRTVEVAVLKTIGLRANQVTILFLVEAVLMGVVGSLFGIILGWIATLFIKGAAETMLATDLPFRIAPGPALNGFIIGTVVTTVFGFLPTLSAGEVRPNVVLRPADNVIPRAGWGRSLAALLVIILVLAVVAQTIVGSFATAFTVIVGAFVAAGFLYLLLSFLIWLVGRLLPSFGLVDLKISLRQMLAGRQRAAVTLMALVVGVFSLSLITLFAVSVANIMEEAMTTASGGNVLISATAPQQLQQVEEAISKLDGVNSYHRQRGYNTRLLSLIDGETGETVSVQELGERVKAFYDSFPFGGDRTLNTEELVQTMIGVISAVDLDNLPEKTILSGRQLTPADAGKPALVLPRNTLITEYAGIKVGDKLNFELRRTGLLTASQTTTLTFEVVGITSQGLVSGIGTDYYAPADAFPPDFPPNVNNLVVDIAAEQVPELRRQLANMRGVFVIETAVFTELIRNLLGTFIAFPTMVALLGLIVGGVVIANSVALTTLERRREIAVMKAVGLQRERVLGMLLLENGILGLIGGLIGVGIGLLNLIILVGTLSVSGSTIPIGTALMLMLLCVAVALIATMATAWGASGEKPLNVLRYD